MNYQTKKMKNLVEELNHYSNSYYNQSVSIISDKEFDKKYTQLIEMEKSQNFVFADSPTRRVGYLPSNTNLHKITHSNPLLSLKKTKDLEEIKGLFTGNPLLVMPKYDGLTLKLNYENGELQSGSTRGDGFVGEDVTHNLVAIAGIPKQIPYMDAISVIGEVYILEIDFKMYQNQIWLETKECVSNSRNLASGSIRLLNPRECMKRNLRFSPFTAYGLTGRTKKSDLELLSKWGFESHFFEVSTEDFDTLEERMSSVRESAQNEGIPIDGIVISVNNKKAYDRLGNTSHHPNGGIAYKFEDDSFETEILDIFWQVNRRGILFPVASVAPVEIEGTRVSKASLFNMDFIQEKNLNIGSQVLISKRNQIIPHIEENLTPGNIPYVFPERCPSCGSVLSHSDSLLCLNESCEERLLAKFTRFCGKKVLDIRGLSEGILQKLLEHGFIHELSDIFELEDQKEELMLIPGFGEVQISNLLRAIEESRTVSLEQVILALDIPLIGRSLSKEIAILCHGDPSFFEVNVQTPHLFSDISGFGEEAEKSIQEWFQFSEHHFFWNELQTILSIQIPEIDSSHNRDLEDFFLYGKKVVLTGTFDHGTRSDITNILSSKGVVVQTSVTKSTDLLICGGKVGETKLKKARAYGVLIEDQSILENQL